MLNVTQAFRKMKLWKSIFEIIYFVYFFYLPYVECQASSKNFTIFWDIPTSLCSNYGVDFDDFLQNIPVAQNSKQLSKNNRITTFYNPGLLGNYLPEKMGEISYVSLQKTDIQKKIFSTFAGLGVLNYTQWHPIFRQNRGSLEYFSNRSIQMEREMYPLLNEDQTLELAEMRFEFVTSLILINSIKNIQNTWPSGTWGLFDYPKCTNSPQSRLSPECDRDVVEDNDKLSWLWELDIALFPALFISMQNTLKNKQQLIKARLREAERISQKYDPPLKIYPYLALSYDNYDLFIQREELIYILRTFFTIETDGLIIWGNENDVNSYSKCHKLHTYFNRYLKDVLNEFWGLIRNRTNV